MTRDRVAADARLLWDFQRMGHPLRTCAVAVGFGSHDLGVAETTARLYHEGWAPLVVFTGATSPTSRERMPRGEAVHYRERAIELGVPAEAVLVETRATNTGENITFTRDLLAAHGIPAPSVLAVTKPYEERRVHATARKLWPAPQWVSASTPQTLADYTTAIGDPKLVIDMLVGAQQRLTLYPRQGFMVEQEIPTEIAAAFDRLCADGFTSRLV